MFLESQSLIPPHGQLFHKSQRTFLMFKQIKSEFLDKKQKNKVEHLSKLLDKLQRELLGND